MLILFLLQLHEGTGKEGSSKAKIDEVADHKEKEVGESKAEGKSKSELRAERRAKQEAQRAAKTVAPAHKTAAKPKAEVAKVKTDKPVGDVVKVR